MHYRKDEGSNAHSKGGRARKHSTLKMRAQRRTQKRVGLENAPPRIRGFKGALGR